MNTLIKDMIRRNLRKDQTVEIVSDTDLINDLGLDSIGIANILADLEVELDITIEIEEISINMFTKYQHLLDFVIAKNISKLVL